MPEKKRTPKKKRPSKKKTPVVRRNSLARISDGIMARNPDTESGFPLREVWDEKEYIIPASLNPFIDHKERLYPLDELIRHFYFILDDDYRSNNTFLPVRCDSERGINSAEESMRNLLSEAVAAIDGGELPAQRAEHPYPIQSVDFVCWLDERYGFKHKPWIRGLVQMFKAGKLKRSFRQHAPEQLKRWEKGGERWPLDKALREILGLCPDHKYPPGTGLTEDFDNLRECALAGAEEGNLDITITAGEPFVNVRSLVAWALDDVNHLPASMQCEILQFLADRYEETQPAENWHSDDFSIITVRERRCELGPKQALMASALWEPSRDGGPGLRTKALKKKAGIVNPRATMHDTWKTLENWRDLFEQPKRGWWRFKF